jgi:hypothetical protein
MAVVVASAPGLATVAAAAAAVAAVAAAAGFEAPSLPHQAPAAEVGAALLHQLVLRLVLLHLPLLLHPAAA